MTHDEAKELLLKQAQRRLDLAKLLEIAMALKPKTVEGVYLGTLLNIMSINAELQMEILEHLKGMDIKVIRPEDLTSDDPTH